MKLDQKEIRVIRALPARRVSKEYKVKPVHRDQPEQMVLMAQSDHKETLDHKVLKEK